MKGQTQSLILEYLSRGKVGDDGTDPRKRTDPPREHSRPVGRRLRTPFNRGTPADERRRAEEEVGANLQRARDADQRQRDEDEEEADRRRREQAERSVRPNLRGPSPRPVPARYRQGPTRELVETEAVERHDERERERVERQVRAQPAAKRVATRLAGGIVQTTPVISDLASEEKLATLGAIEPTVVEQYAQRVGQGAGVLGTMLGAGKFIGAQNQVLGRIAPALPARAAPLIEAMENPGTAGRGMRALAGGTEGMLFDVATGHPGERAENVGLGTAMGAAVGAILPGASSTTRLLAERLANAPPRPRPAALADDLPTPSTFSVGAPRARPGSITGVNPARELLPAAAAGDNVGSQLRPGERPQPAPQVKHGLVPEFRQVVPDYAPDPTVPKLPQKANPRNAPKVVEAMESIHQHHPEPLASEESWARMMVDVVKDQDVPMAPRRAIRYANDPESVHEILARATPEQVRGWWQGRSVAKEIGAEYAAGRATPEQTGALFLWGISSRGVGAYFQEGAYLDAMAGGVTPFIRKALDGTFTEADEAAYSAWLKTALPEASPGRSATHNLEAFGASLRKLSRPGASGESLLMELHRKLSDPKETTESIRRWFQGASEEGLGIDNKVLSFLLLVTGRPGLVLDRIQIDHLFEGERFPWNIYEGRKVERIAADGKKKRVAEGGTSVAELFGGARGAMIYEAMERSIGRHIPATLERLRAENPEVWGQVGDLDIGDFHWLTWVIRSDQVVEHSTTQSFLRQARGEDPVTGLGVSHGKFGEAEGSATYLRTPDGPRVRYPLSDGRLVEMTPQELKAALNEVRDPRSGVLPRRFKFGEGPHGEERTDFWYNDPRVDRTALDTVLLGYGRVVGEVDPRAAGADPAAAARPGSGGGRGGRGGLSLYANPLDPAAIRRALDTPTGRTAAAGVGGAVVGATADALTGEDEGVVEGALGGAAAGLTGAAILRAMVRDLDQVGGVDLLDPPTRRPRPAPAEEAISGAPTPPPPVEPPAPRPPEPAPSPPPSDEELARSAKEARRGLAPTAYERRLGEGEIGEEYLRPDVPSEPDPALFNRSTMALDPSGGWLWRQEEQKLIEQGVQKRRVTDDEVREFAQEVNLPDLVKSRAQSLDTVQLYALGSAIQRARQRLVALTEQLRSTAPGAEREALDEEYDLVFRALLELDKRITAASSEQGRGLRILSQIAATNADSPEFATRVARKILGVDDLPADVESEIRRIYSDGLTHSQSEAATEAIGQGQRVLSKKAQLELARYLTRLQTSTPAELLLGTRRWSMLTAPVTHVLNTASGAVHSLTEGFVVRPLAAGLDRWILRRAADERRATFSASIAAARVRGMREGAASAVGRDEYLRAAQAAAAAGESKLRQVMEGGKAALSQFLSGVDPDNPLAALNQRRLNYAESMPGWASPAARLLQAGHDAVYAVMQLPDKIFFTGALKGSLQERAELRAMREGLKRGSAEWTARVRDLTTPETAHAEDTAGAFMDALYETFKGRSAASQVVSSARRVAPRTTDLLAPFTLTPINLFLTSIDYTPGLGVARNEIRLRRGVATGTIEDAEADRQRLAAWARSFGAGGALVLYGMQLRAQERLSLPYSEREQQEDRNMKTQEDIPDGAVKVGDRWHRIGMLGPQSLVVLAGGAMYDAMVADSGASLPGRLLGGAGAAGLTVADQISDLPVVQTLGDFKEAAGGAGNRLAVWAGRQAASFLPFGAAVAAGGRAMDPVRDRRPSTFGEAIEERLPGLREGVPEKVSGLGDVAENPGVGTTLTNPMRSQPDRVGRGDQVIDLLHQYNVDASPITRLGWETGHEVAERQKAVGRQIRSHIEMIVGDEPPAEPREPGGRADDTAWGRYRKQLRQWEQDMNAWEDWRDMEKIAARLAGKGDFTDWTAEEIEFDQRRKILEEAISTAKSRYSRSDEQSPRRERKKTEERGDRKERVEQLRQRLLKDSPRGDIDLGGSR